MENPLPADANQHGIGNCSLVAALASMAYIYPDFIKSLIQDNGDKTYTVSMFDPQGKPIKVCVSSKFLAGQSEEMFCCTGKDNKATWATVLEKAIMKWNYIFNVNKNTGGIGSEHVPPVVYGRWLQFRFCSWKTYCMAVATCCDDFFDGRKACDRWIQQGRFGGS